jgi:hypothetical protein
MKHGRRGDIFIPILVVAGIAALAGGSFWYKFTHTPPAVPELVPAPSSVPFTPPVVNKVESTSTVSSTPVRVISSSTATSSAGAGQKPPTTLPFVRNVQPLPVPASSTILPSSTPTTTPEVISTPTSSPIGVSGGGSPVVPVNMQNCITEIENSNIPEDQIEALMAECINYIREFESGGGGALQGMLRLPGRMTASLTSALRPMWNWLWRD